MVRGRGGRQVWGEDNKTQKSLGGGRKDLWPKNTQLPEASTQALERGSETLVGTKGDFSIDKRRSNSKDSLEIIKYIVVKQIVTNGRKLIIFTNF